MLSLATLLHAGSTPEFDPNTVTPGVVGFIITFGVAAAVVLLVLDMVRRVRRLRYREEIREQIDAEEAAALFPDQAGDDTLDDSADRRRPGDN